MKKLLFLFAGLLTLALVLMGAREPRVDLNNSGFPLWIQKGLYIGTAASDPVSSQDNKVSRLLGASATIDFASTSVGRVESSGITLTGAQVSDPCTVGVPATQGALAAQYSCYVSAANTVKVVFTPLSVQSGSITTADAGTGIAAGTATVTASSVCQCTNSTTLAAMKCSVSSTTLTALTAAEADAVKYLCVAPVDPGSGTFYVRVISSQ